MNGLRTRNTLHTTWRPAREQRTRLDSFETMLAKICWIGVIAMLIWQLAEMVAA